MRTASLRFFPTRPKSQVNAGGPARNLAPKGVMGKPVIAIRIPTLGTVNSALSLFTNALVAADNLPYRFEVGIITGYKPHDYARNVAVSSVLKDDRVEKLWFIDSDVIPNPGCVKLVQHDADIVGCPCPVVKRYEGLLRPQETTYVFSDKKGMFDPVHLNGEGICEVDSLGMGMTVIHKRVLSDPKMWLPNKAGSYKTKKKSLEHILFRHSYNPDGSMAVGEDVDFCGRAKKLGYKVLADSSVQAGHIKELDVLEVHKALWAKSESQ